MVDAFQLRVIVVGWSIAPATGEMRVGTTGSGGTATIVVKLRWALKALVPALFFARTRQKYRVLLLKELTCRDVAVIV